MVKKKKRNPVITDIFEEKKRHLIVTGVSLGTVLLDDFTNPIYSEWESKTADEKMKILDSRKPTNYFDVDKIEESLYRIMYKLEPSEPISIGTIHKLTLRKKKKHRCDNFVECTKDPNNTIQ